MVLDEEHTVPLSILRTDQERSARSDEEHFATGFSEEREGVAGTDLIGPLSRNGFLWRKVRIVAVVGDLSEPNQIQH